MRFLISLHDQKQGYALSSYLTKNGLENKLELISDNDWSSPDYGTTSSSIWVIDEDHFEEAKKIAEEFSVDPKNIRFYQEIQPERTEKKPAFPSTKPPLRKKTPIQEPIGRLTGCLLVLCSLLLFFGEISMPEIERAPPGNLPLTPFVMPPIYKVMMFDYPYAYDILDKIIKAYGEDSFSAEGGLPREGQLLLDQFHRTPYWIGLYDIFLNAHQTGTSMRTDAPLFEKEQKGEFWRLLTPCFLHADILHLVFNMLWLAILGRQMEHRLGFLRYAFFIAVVGVASNIAQYLIGGSNFLGFSGILCGMLTFIWERRRHAPWEGYQLQPGTIGFIAFFILLMFAIQFATFIGQYYFNFSLSPGIANTAHLAGAFFGYLLAKADFFAWKTT